MNSFKKNKKLKTKIYAYSFQKNFPFAIKGNSIFKVAYANNSLEFINELRWTKFKGYGIDQSLYLKIKTFEL